eukprot:GFYU01002245.1.p1 GENE.GFYU01002245.1~~GFYU01002245.1.p1  ORF type:complete len:363 (+),score=44.29 GFYU01002245.1:104-1192(+)
MKEAGPGQSSPAWNTLKEPQQCRGLGTSPLSAPLSVPIPIVSHKQNESASSSLPSSGPPSMMLSRTPPKAMLSQAPPAPSSPPKSSHWTPLATTPPKVTEKSAWRLFGDGSGGKDAAESDEEFVYSYRAMSGKQPLLEPTSSFRSSKLTTPTPAHQSLFRRKKRLILVVSVVSLITVFGVLGLVYGLCLLPVDATMTNMSVRYQDGRIYVEGTMTVTNPNQRDVDVSDVRTECRLETETRLLHLGRIRTPAATVPAADNLAINITKSWTLIDHADAGKIEELLTGNNSFALVYEYALAYNTLGFKRSHASRASKLQASPVMMNSDTRAKSLDGAVVEARSDVVAAVVADDGEMDDVEPQLTL